MTKKFILPTTLLLLFTLCSCLGQDAPAKESQSCESEKKEPHRYGGWYCPDNFGFVPVDIQKINEVPAISNRLPTEEELSNNMSLIKVDTEKYPDARALEMDLPRVATIYSDRNGLDELIIVIQAIVVSGDTVVGYRFANGGNGSAWMSDVKFLDQEALNQYGSQPFFYSTDVVNANKEDIWEALCATKYFKNLGEKFDHKDFFSSDWTSESRAFLELDVEGERAVGFVGTVFGNAYLHIDYDRDGFHYSEKLLMIEDQENNTTKLFFASGPFPEAYESKSKSWSNWFDAVKQASEGE